MKKKRIIFIFTILVCFLLSIDNVFAASQKCRYKVTYIDGKETYTDHITIEFTPGEGMSNKIHVESTNSDYEINKNRWAPTGKVFKDKDLYVDPPNITFNEYIFNDPNVKTCPSQLSYFIFGYHYALGGYIFGHSQNHKDNYSPNGTIVLDQEQTTTPPSDVSEEDGRCVCCGKDKNNCTYSWIHKKQKPGYSCSGVDLTKDKCVGSVGSPTGNEKQYCSDAYVINKYSSGAASGSKYYSLKVQYYMENNRKYIEMVPVEGSKESEMKKSFELHPDVGNVVDITEYKAETGKYLRVETFDKCDKVKIVTCDTDDKDGVYIGTKCDENNNADPETVTTPETQEEYQQHYNTNFAPFVVPAPGGGSFGKSANCLAIMGGSDGAAYKIINGAVNIIRILAPIVAIVNAMIVLMPAITAKDETGLKTATKKCVIIGVVLLIIEVFPYVVRLIGAVFGFDLSCIG